MELRWQRRWCWLVLPALIATGVGGCHGGGPFGQKQATTQGIAAGQVNPAAVRAQAMALSDSYSRAVVQSLERLMDTTKRPEVKAWAVNQRIQVSLACLSNATGPNDVACLLDMLGLITLRHEAMEKYWMPTMLHGEGVDVLDVENEAEVEAWSGAATVLSQGQLDELRTLINQWSAQHPGEYNVMYIRFADIAADQHVSSGSWFGGKPPSNVLSLLYLNPLSGLDPVTQELASYRALTERLLFLVTRMPQVIAWEVDQRISLATSEPSILDFVANTKTFAAATDKFATATAGYPKDISAERDAAIIQLHEAVTAERKATIDQTAAAVTAQRDAILKELDARESQLHQMIADVNGVVDHADRTGLSLNDATQRTVQTTEAATQRLTHQIFIDALILVVAIVLGIIAVLLVARRRNGQKQSQLSAAP